MKLLVINGPNMNMLGIRQPDIYGRKTYADLVEYISTACGTRGVEVEFYQSNHEGAIVDKIQEAYQKADGIVINAAAYTHTSVAIADALAAVGIPAVEVHISDVQSREEFRHVSYIKKNCIAVCAGHGFDSYVEAIDVLIENEKSSKGDPHHA